MASNKRLNATITIGGTITGALRSAFGTTTKNLTAIGRSIRTLTDRQKELTRVIRDQEKLGPNGSALRVRYANQELAAIEKQISALRRREAITRRIEGARAANLARRSEVRGQLFDAVAIGAAAGAPVAAAVQFENAMLGVAKQLDGARDSSGKLTAKYYDMAKAIQKLGQELPTPTEQIAEMVTAGLRMGVASDQVLDFVRATSQMATAFELPEGELAESMGKIANLFKIPIPNITELADTINYLDDNAISKGGDIIEFLQRTGGVAGAVKVTGKDMAALGSTLLTLGESADTSSTAVNAMFGRLAAATKGTKQFRAAMGEVGLSLKSVQQGMQTDALGTMQKVFAAIAKRNPKDHLGLLVQMFGREHAPKLVKLVTGVSELNRQLELANSEAAKGSMGREFAARMETVSAQFQITKNRVNELAVNIGSVLLPAINSLMKGIGPVVSTIADLAKEYPTLTKWIVGSATALTASRIAWLGGAYVLTFVKGAVLSLAAGAVKLAPAIRLVGTAVAFMGRMLLLNPIGLAVTAIAGAAVLIYKNWEPVKAWFKSLWDDITATFDKAIGWITSKIDWVGEKWRGVKSFFGFGDASPAAAPSGGPLPPPPALASRGGAGGGMTDNSQNTYNITQLPGENAEALARRITEIQEQQRQVRMRSRAYDEATP